ncbi:MAG: vitamin B12-dependent ribonucleotide reductase [Acidothermus cellulolyticus]|nr:vitamin B12-dependent ribonucleotide reductase [Acidothermus cellulolyticus]
MTEPTSGARAQMDGSGRRGLTMQRIYTTPGVHPYDEVNWVRRDVVMTNWRDGSVNFEQRGVEFPDFWSQNAVNIVTTKYFRGALGTPQREWSLKQLVDRVVKTYAKAGLENGYFATPDDATIFEHELAHALVHQVFSFNSPVWFNVGTPAKQQVSACQPYSAPVSTPDGPIPIGKLVDANAVGEKVFDASGVTRIVATTCNGRKPVLRIRTSGGHVLDVTPDHLVWQVIDQTAGRFVPAGQLRVGDRLEWHDRANSDAMVAAFPADSAAAAQPGQIVDILAIDELGVMPVYDIQTESGEYLSDGIRVHNCFILSVDDTMESILDWYKEEGLIFKGGSGAGVNLSRIRSSKELLSSGGTASGPVSFMRGADASAGTIKSGGATRRAAKMVILDVDHPDIEEFIETKVREEEKIRVLRDAGFDMDLGGRDLYSVQYQNANNSVRVSDEFMRAVERGESFGLRARTTGEVIETVDARKLFRKMAEAAWACADPGIQYDDTINDWHTCPESGRITASNPCSEYMHLDNSSCNLASLNLMKFLTDDGRFDIDTFIKVVELVITAMDISICFADFPTEKIADTTRRFRQLGIGYANLGALLMATGHAYDSDGGRALAAAITSLMTATAYKRSAELAAIVGPYDGYARNAEAHKRVMRKHAAASDALRPIGEMDRAIAERACQMWRECLTLGEQHGWRNSQASVLAPTGTIGLAMDCDTTGIEPDLALVKFKKLVGGGSMQIVNRTVPRALRTLGYPEEQVEAIVEYISEHGSVVGAPGLRPEHYEVFDCAMGDRAISPMGHVRMMAAVQPFISGAISKTVNMPESATVEDVEEIYFQGWKLGLKALAIYRNNCKVGQPLSDAKEKKVSAAAEGSHEHRPVRRRLPKRRPSQTISFSVGGAEGYLTAGSYPDNGLGEVFLKLGKQGSTLAGVMDAFAIAISIALQYGVPLEAFVSKFVNMRFEPSGMTDDPDIRFASSIMDYIFRRLALDYLPYEKREELGIFSAEERARKQSGELSGASAEPLADETADSVTADDAEARAETAVAGSAPRATTSGSGGHGAAELVDRVFGQAADAPLCMNCGTTMRPAGSCYVCEGCGSTSGCS